MRSVLRRILVAVATIPIVAGTHAQSTIYQFDAKGLAVAKPASAPALAKSAWGYLFLDDDAPKVELANAWGGFFASTQAEARQVLAKLRAFEAETGVWTGSNSKKYRTLSFARVAGPVAFVTLPPDLPRGEDLFAVDPRLDDLSSRLKGLLDSPDLDAVESDDKLTSLARPVSNLYRGLMAMRMNQVATRAALSGRPRIAAVLANSAGEPNLLVRDAEAIRALSLAPDRTAELADVTRQISAELGQWVGKTAFRTSENGTITEARFDPTTQTIFEIVDAPEYGASGAKHYTFHLDHLQPIPKDTRLVGYIDSNCQCELCKRRVAEARAFNDGGKPGGWSVKRLSLPGSGSYNPAPRPAVEAFAALMERYMDLKFGANSNVPDSSSEEIAALQKIQAALQLTKDAAGDATLREFRELANANSPTVVQAAYLAKTAAQQADADAQRRAKLRADYEFGPWQKVSNGAGIEWRGNHHGGVEVRGLDKAYLTATFQIHHSNYGEDGAVLFDKWDPGWVQVSPHDGTGGTVGFTGSQDVRMDFLEVRFDTYGEKRGS